LPTFGKHQSDAGYGKKCCFSVVRDSNFIEKKGCMSLVLCFSLLIMKYTLYKRILNESRG